MNRSSGIGLAVAGVVVLVIGLILRLATSVHSSGFNIHKVGDGLLLIGVIVVIWSIVVLARGRARSRA